MRERLKLPLEEIATLYHQGYSSTELGEMYSCDGQTIRKRLKEMGIPLRHRWNFKRPRIKVPKVKWKLAYMAGIIDGEGTICFVESKTAKYGRVPTIGIANTSLELLRWIEKVFGGNINRKPVKGKNRKPQYQWRCRAMREVLILGEAILPLLVVKKDACKRVIAFCKKRLAEYY